MGHSEQMLQAMDSEAQERRRHEIAARLHFAKMDGYLNDGEFSFLLGLLGIGDGWEPTKGNDDE